MMGGKLFHPPDEITLARWIELLKKAVELMAAINIKLALENHSDFYMEQMEEIVLKCGSPFFGITLDSANAFRIGEDELETVKRLAPYAFHLHLKDYVTAPEVEGGVRHVGLGEGELPIKDMLHILQESGYRGAWNFELTRMNGAQDERDAARKSVLNLKHLLLQTP